MYNNKCRDELLGFSWMQNQAQDGLKTEEKTSTVYVFLTIYFLNEIRYRIFLFSIAFSVDFPETVSI